MKRLWQQRRKAAGKSIHEPGPNIVMGANAQVALEKFARYFDVECRLVPVSVESNYRLDPKKAMEYVDENTVGVYVILGSTYTGHYEPVKEMADLLDEYEKQTGTSVPIHGTIIRRVTVPLTDLKVVTQSMERLADLLRPLFTQISSGTSGSLVLSPSTLPVTSSVSRTLVSAGFYGGRKNTFQRI